jgi:putative glycosyltransferase
VTTLYNSAPYLAEFHSRCSAAAAQITDDVEFVLVNDGSPDNSLEVALGLHRSDGRVRVIDLSRNFGHHKAIMTGLAHARGDLVFLLDSDLEEEPELLFQFQEQLKATGADVVFGVQEKRKGALFERISGNLYFKVFNLMSALPIPPNHITARLMTRRYVTALMGHEEREFVMSGLWALTGFTQVPVTVTKHHTSPSAYNLRRKFSHLVNAITSFSNKPLVFIFYLGSVIMLIASLAALDMIIRRLFFGVLLEGWASLIVSIWLLGGITIFCLGVIGIYLAKIFTETKQRPYTIIRDVYEHPEPSEFLPQRTALHKQSEPSAKGAEYESQGQA